MFEKLASSLCLIACISQLTTKADPLPRNATPIDYDGCGTQYQCIGFGIHIYEDCVVNMNCNVLLKTKSITMGAKFTLFWSREETSADNSVLVGLSKDMDIGDDSVTKFSINADNTVQYENGLSTKPDDQGKFGFIKLNITPSFGIFVEKTEYSNGLLTAVWVRDLFTTVGNIDFNLQTDNYHIFFAYGHSADKADSQSYTVEYIDPVVVIIDDPSRIITTGTSLSPTKATTASPITSATIIPTTAPTIGPTTAPTKAPTKAPTIAPTTAQPKVPTTATTQPPTTVPIIASTVKIDVRKQQLLDYVKEIDIRLSAEIKLVNDRGLKFLFEMLQKELNKINLIANELQDNTFVPEALKTFEDNLAAIEQRITNVLRFLESQTYRQLLKVDDILGDASQLVQLLNNDIVYLQSIESLNAYNDAKLLRDYKEKLESLMEQIILSQNENELENNGIDIEIYSEEAKIELINMETLYGRPPKPL